MHWIGVALAVRRRRTRVRSRHQLELLLRHLKNSAEKWLCEPDAMRFIQLVAAHNERPARNILQNKFCGLVLVGPAARGNIREV